MIWKGKSPFTVGLTDDDGNVIESYTALPGMLIPKKWLKVIWKAQSENNLHAIDDKGNYDPAQVKREINSKRTAEVVG